MWCVLNFGEVPKYAEPEEKLNWVKNQELILTELINYNPDLYIKYEGMTFWDMLNQDAYDFMKNNFIKEFEEYEIKKSANKYNL